MYTPKEHVIYTLKELLMYIKKWTLYVYTKKNLLCIQKHELVMYTLKYFLFSIYSTSTLNVKLKRTITLYTFTFFYYRGLVHKKNYLIGSNFIGYSANYFVVLEILLFCFG